MKRYMLIMPLVMAILFCCTVQGQPNQQINPQIIATTSNYSFQHSMLPGTITQGLTQVGTTQGTSGAASNTNQSASWSERPLSGQVTTQGGTPQTMAFQMNLNQSMGQGLGQTISPGVSQNQSAVLQYSQYYKITPQAPSKPLTSPTKYELSQEPTMLYFGGSGSQKALSYSQYQSYMMYTGQNSLWIQGPTSWTQYACCAARCKPIVVGNKSFWGIRIPI